ncbi:MAG: hypothetical protein ABI835_02010 [Chloroflexota bacterium]
MKTWRIALFLLLLMLVLIVPVYAQESTPAADATTEATANATLEPSVESTAEATVEATIDAVISAPTAEATAELAGSEAEPPETSPVAGVAEETDENGLRGSPLLVLLIGLGAVAVVGLGTLMRENFTPPQE